MITRTRIKTKPKIAFLFMKLKVNTKVEGPEERTRQKKGTFLKWVFSKRTLERREMVGAVVFSRGVWEWDTVWVWVLVRFWLWFGQTGRGVVWG